MSENYYQHADHFTRVLNEQENSRVSRINTNSIETNNNTKNNSDEEKNFNTDDEDKQSNKEATKNSAVS